MRDWLRRFQRPSDAEFSAEIDAHLAHETDEQIERGLSPEEARFAALRRFGNVTRHLERFREASLWFWLETLWLDMRAGWRSLWRTPVLSCAALLSLALGIGANVAVYTVVHAVLVDPLHLPDQQRLFALRAPDSPLAYMPPLRRDDVDRVVRLSAPFGTVGPWLAFQTPVRHHGRVTQQMLWFASEGAVEALGVRPALGRWPSADEYRSGAPVMVLTHREWEHQGRDAHVLGRRLRVRPQIGSGLADLEFTVIGVAAASFHGLVLGVPYGGIAPLRAFESLAPNIRQAPVLFVGMLGRLKEGHPMAQAAQQVAAWRLEPSTVGAEPPKVELVPAAEAAIAWGRRDTLRRTLRVLWAFAGLVLLMGCVNLASAMLARSEGRRHELAMRVSLGATRARLVRLIGIEYLLLVVLSTAAALLISRLMLQTFPAGLALGWSWMDIPIEVRLSLTWPIAVVAAALGVACGILFGLAPAARLTRLDPMLTLRRGGSSRHTDSSRPRRWCLGAQVATTTMLLAAALLLVQAVSIGQAADAGYDRPEHLLFARPHMGRTIGTSASRAVLLEEVTDRLGAHASAAIGFARSAQPFVPSDVADRVVVDGRERAVSGRDLAPIWGAGRVFAEGVDPAFRGVVGLRLLYGRDLHAGDARSSSPGVLVNEALARQLGAPHDAVGRQLRVHLLGDTWLPAEGSAQVVGVVGNARFDVKAGTAPCIYFVTDEAQGLYIRTTEDARYAAPRVRRALQSIHPDDPPPFVISHADFVGEALAVERLLRRVLVWFAVLALVLSVVGIYGLTTDGLARRTREIALRLVLGAPERSVLTLVLRATVLVSVAGVAVGLIGAAVGTLLVDRLLLGIGPFRTTPYVAAVAIVLASALVAMWQPVRRVLRFPLTESLRAD